MAKGHSYLWRSDSSLILRTKIAYLRVSSCTMARFKQQFSVARAGYLVMRQTKLECRRPHNRNLVHAQQKDAAIRACPSGFLAL
jgi:hypothetical protein